MNDYLVVGAVSTINLVLAGLILFRDKTNFYTKSFGISTFFVGMWGVSTILLNIYVTMFYERMLFLVALSAIFFIFLFSFEYVKEVKKWILYVMSALYVLLSILIAFTNAIVKDVYKPEYSTGIEVELGGGIYLFILCVLIYFTILGINLSEGRKKGTILKRQQVRYITLGIFSFVIPSIVTNLLLPVLGIYRLNNVGIVFSLAFTGFVTISIVKYRLFSIRTILLKLAQVIILGVILFTFVLALRILKDVGLNLEPYEFWALGIDLVAAVFVALVIRKINHSLNQYLSKLIKAEIYFLEDIIRELENKVSLQVNEEKVSNIILNLLSKAFVETDVKIINKSSKGFDRYNSIIVQALSSDKDSILGSSNNVVVRQEMGADSNVREELEKEDVAILASLREDVIILFTDKKNKEAFFKTELDTIEDIVSRLRIIYERLKLYSRLENFNKTLREKVAQATEELREKNSRLEEARRKERDMMDIMGHELRTPSSVVKINAEMLDSAREKIDFGNKEECKKFVEQFDKSIPRIREAIENELRLINILLTSAKMEGNRLELHREEIDIVKAIDFGIHSQENDAEEKGLYIKFAKPDKVDKIPTVYADKVRLQEIIFNLINNAVKYTSKGGVTISVELLESKGLVKVNIHDTGIGIPEIELDKLGQKFYRVGQYLNDEGNDNEEQVGRRTKATIVRPGGTGLGLYVTFELIKAYDGKIDIKSEIGKGSTFSFTIPVFNPELQKDEKKDEVKDVFTRLGLKKKK